MLKIYLAGPDVFEKDALQQGERLKERCSAYGFEGLFPLDNVINFDASPYEVAKAIRKANVELIASCDIVMANLNPFRGVEPDSGTVYEVGYATALGKKVYGYAQDRREMIERIRSEQQLHHDAVHCKSEKCIEDFGLSHNLMMIDVVVAQDAEACLKQIALEQNSH